MKYPLFETIAIEDAIIQRLELHQQRYEKSLHQFYCNLAPKDLQIQSLENLIHIPTALKVTKDATLIRCRIRYNNQECVVEYFPYERKNYQSFKPIICDEIDYRLKFSDRTLLNQLLAQRGDCDEIIIIKQGCVTDCSIGNLIFRRGTQWFTPDTPLFEGTQRACLISQNRIQVCRIRLEDLGQFEEIRIINALNSL